MRCGVNRGRARRDAESYKEGRARQRRWLAFRAIAVLAECQRVGVDDEAATLLTDWRSCISQIWYARISPAAMPSMTM